MENEYYERDLVFGHDKSSLKRKALACLMCHEGIEKEKISAVIGVSIRQIYNYVHESVSIDGYEDKR